MIGCPEPTVAQAVVDAAIVFCEDSMVIREVLDSITLEIGNGAYTLDAPQHQSITRVLNAWVDGVQIQVNPQDQVNPLRTATGPIQGCFTSRAGSEFALSVYPLPDKAYTLTVECALRPVRGATQLEDDLYELWVQPISDGAISRLASIPDQPYTNINLAGSRQMQFLLASRRALVESSYNRTRGTSTVRPRPLA